MDEPVQVPSQNSNGVVTCVVVAVLILAFVAALAIGIREAATNLSLSVTNAGQGILSARAQQELAKAQATQIENERRAAAAAQEKIEREEFTRQWVRVVEIGLPAMASLAAIVVAVIAFIVIVQTRKAAPELRQALVHAAQLRAAQVKLDGHTRAWPLLKMPNGTVFNPNIQLEPGKPVDGQLAQGFYYVQAIGAAGDAAARIASRLSNQNSQVADALPGIVSGVNLVEGDNR